MRLLIVEDDADLAAALTRAFAARSYATDHAATVADAELLIESRTYAAVILDLGLPDEDGLSLLKRMRSRKDPLPVLVVTARGDIHQRIDGLDAGADDYVAKPFAFDELHARLNAVLRRKGGYLERLLSLGNVSLDLETREAMVGEVNIGVSAREAELLELFLRRANRVLPRSVAEDQLFGANDDLGSNAIEVYIHRLRSRLKDHGATVQVDTVRGVGYILRAKS